MHGSCLWKLLPFAGLVHPAGVGARSACLVLSTAKLSGHKWLSLQRKGDGRRLALPSPSRPLVWKALGETTLHLCTLAGGSGLHVRLGAAFTRDSVPPDCWDLGARLPRPERGHFTAALATAACPGVALASPRGRPTQTAVGLSTGDEDGQKPWVWLGDSVWPRAGYLCLACPPAASTWGARQLTERGTCRRRLEAPF